MKKNAMNSVSPDERARRYITPTRIVWRQNVRDAETLLRPGSGQATIWSQPGAFLPPGASLVLDYGKELHGGVQIISGRSKDEKVLKARVRFGESVSEAMGTPNNDHAMHDSVIDLATMGGTEFGNTGFRFVRIDSMEKEEPIEIRELRAVSIQRDLKYRGSVECDDKRLNEIWKTGAYTTHLCLQDYLWDGIKRDRLVWMGDMHPEIMTAATVFGQLEVVERSLDLVRDETELPNSFCHGWASGPIAWLPEHILGVKVMKPGAKLISLEPHLPGLQWVRGSFPTPLGDLEVEVSRKKGIVHKAPKGVKVDTTRFRSKSWQ